MRVGVIFGSRSVEHEVSIVTALQVIAALNSTTYDVVPIYITKRGQWLTGPGLTSLETLRQLAVLSGELPAELAVHAAMIGPDTTVRHLLDGDSSAHLNPPKSGRGGLFRRRSEPTVPDVLGTIDVALPCTHGTHGEDGTLQGLLELGNIPYVGCGVTASAVGMDKLVMKAVFQAAGLPFVPYLGIRSADWQARPAETLDRIEAALKYPIFVKPANLGSSVGITKARTRDEASKALDIAVVYDNRLIVEQSVEGATEVNCSVLGGGAEPACASICEEPVAWQEILTYDDKYLRGGVDQGMKGATRRIPADIGPDLTQRVQSLALETFDSIDAAGVSRIDFLVDRSAGQVYVNEINTIPGSLSFYLWEPSGVPFPVLLDRLIDIAVQRHSQKSDLLYTYDSTLLSNLGGIKGSKVRQSQ